MRPVLLRASRAPVGSEPAWTSVVAGLMSNTIQYSRGVIGVAASSTTRASDFVPGGMPDQKIGGVSRAP